MEKCTFLSFVNSLVRNISLLTYFIAIADIFSLTVSCAVKLGSYVERNLLS